MEFKSCYVCKERKEEEEFYVSDWICKPCRKTWNHEKYTRRRIDLMLKEEPFASLMSMIEELSDENKAMKSKLKKYRKDHENLDEELREEISTLTTKVKKVAKQHK